MKFGIDPNFYADLLRNKKMILYKGNLYSPQRLNGDVDSYVLEPRDKRLTNEYFKFVNVGDFWVLSRLDKNTRMWVEVEVDEEDLPREASSSLRFIYN